LLLLNAEAEQEICFPAIFGHGPEGLAATGRAIADHDDIREAICEARLQDAGSGAWWRAVTATRRASSNHFTGPESSALILFGRCGPADLRQTLGQWWINFVAARPRDRETGRTRRSRVARSHERRLLFHPSGLGNPDAARHGSWLPATGRRLNYGRWADQPGDAGAGLPPVLVTR
jgi:hypothetical protein